MVKMIIGDNEAGQRLDRFLKKYYGKAPLSAIYKMIRKDVKLNGRRVKEDTMLSLGDEITIYISEEQAEDFRKEKKVNRVRKNFTIVYEDDNVLIAAKPFGLLTHGDEHEKKNHLTNQVISYLIEKGEYNPRTDRTFTPSPANRLDRNTTGLVLFAKTAAALRAANKTVREEGRLSKYYLTIVSGKMTSELYLRDRMEKDHSSNKVTVLSGAEGDGKLMETKARPVLNGVIDGRHYTMVEVELITGRTHQIRAHLAKAGYPVIGDAKYGDRRDNEYMAKRFGLTTQFLHAYRLFFSDAAEELSYLSGKTFRCPLPQNMREIAATIFGSSAEQYIGD